MYSIDSGETWTNEIPTGNAAGSYTLLVKYAGDENHEDFFGETLTVVIQSSEDEDKDKGDQEDQKDDENDNNNNNNSSDSGNNDKSNDNKTTDGSTDGNKSKASSETRSAQTGDSGVTLPVVLALAAASALGLSLYVVKKRNTKNS